MTSAPRSARCMPTASGANMATSTTRIPSSSTGEYPSPILMGCQAPPPGRLQLASIPRSFVRMRMTSSTVVIQILPSPILPVVAASAMTSARRKGIGIVTQDLHLELRDEVGGERDAERSTLATIEGVGRTRHPGGNHPLLDGVGVEQGPIDEGAGGVDVADGPGRAHGRG